MRQLNLKSSALQSLLGMHIFLLYRNERLWNHRPSLRTFIDTDWGSGRSPQPSLKDFIRLYWSLYQHSGIPIVPEILNIQSLKIHTRLHIHWKWTIKTTVSWYVYFSTLRNYTIAPLSNNDFLKTWALTLRFFPSNTQAFHQLPNIYTCHSLLEDRYRWFGMNTD
jgi:hypothetical protein